MFTCRGWEGNPPRLAPGSCPQFIRQQPSTKCNINYAQLVQQSKFHFFSSSFRPDEWAASLLHSTGFSLSATTHTHAHTHICYVLYTQVNKVHVQLVDWLSTSRPKLSPYPGYHRNTGQRNSCHKKCIYCIFYAESLRSLCPHKYTPTFPH